MYWGPVDWRRADAPSEIGLKNCDEQVSVSRRGRRNPMLLKNFHQLTQEWQPQRSKFLGFDEAGVSNNLQSEACQNAVV